MAIGGIALGTNEIKKISALLLLCLFMDLIPGRQLGIFKGMDPIHEK